jgi:hypothetical protein
MNVAKGDCRTPLGSSEASVKGALQRARATLEARLPAGREHAPPPGSPRERQLAGRFAAAVGCRWRRPIRPVTGRWCGGRPAAGIPVQAGAPAVEAGLVEFGGRARFRHPLARSAVYRSASFSDTQQMHAALADVTDPITDPDRRAWHRAQAAAGPDEVAAELERSAGRRRPGAALAAAAAFLERSMLLSADPARLARPWNAGDGGGRAAG